LEFKDAVIDDPKQRRPDITLAKSRLNWAPHVNSVLYFFSIYQKLYFLDSTD
jgi:hypothetical protein